VDLRDPDAVAAVRALILDRADIVLQNLKVGSLEAAGLGAAELTSAKPSLVYCNLGAFGRVGPRRGAPGYDPLIQAFSGFMAMLGNPGDAPSRVPIAVNDIGTGIWGALGVLAALVRRKDTGKGGVVDVSLFETALSWMTIPASDYMASGELPQRLGSGVGNIVPYQAWDLADGRLMIAAGNDLLFGKLCRVLRLDALAEDPRFATNGARVANRWELIALLADAIRTWRTAELTRALQQAGVPCGPVNTVDVALADAQTEALGIVQQLPGGPRSIALPLSFDGRRPPVSGPAPVLGEHQDILAGKTP
jgi:crotonobetainyl-CoA:carnitine CoA-transferase CaiB-like acyl-CoA transferase